MDEYTLEEFNSLCEELADNDPEFSTLVADGFDKAIIGAGQICGNMTVVYDLEKVYDILVEMGMTREDAVEYYCYNIAGSCGADMPLFMDMKVIQKKTGTQCQRCETIVPHGQGWFLYGDVRVCMACKDKYNEEYEKGNRDGC